MEFLDLLLAAAAWLAVTALQLAVLLVVWGWLMMFALGLFAIACCVLWPFGVLIFAIIAPPVLVLWAGLRSAAQWVRRRVA